MEGLSFMKMATLHTHIIAPTLVVKSYVTLLIWLKIINLRI